jgi:hypothetical protein
VPFCFPALQQRLWERAILSSMARAKASLRTKIDRFLNGFEGWSAKRIAKANAEWQGELMELASEGFATAREVDAALERVGSAASELESSQAQLQMDQAVANAKDLAQELEEALVTIRGPGTFIYDFLTLINRGASFAERSASLARTRERFRRERKGLLPIDPAAKAAILQRKKEDKGLKLSLLDSFLMAAGRSEEPQTVRIGTAWIRDGTGAVANIVPARHFGPVTAEFQKWFQKETRNFFEADLLHREHPPACKDALNEPREDWMRVDGIENADDTPKGESADKDVAAVRYDLAKVEGPEQYAMRRELVDVLKSLSPSDRVFLARMNGARGASGAQRTRLSRLRKKIRKLM